MSERKQDEAGELEGLGRLFFEVHRDLPREGPGSAASTRRAIALARPHLPEAPRVVDVACGPGAQTCVLVDELADASITAFDLYDPFLDQLRTSLRGHPGAERVTIVQADMRTWSPPSPAHLIWCEGAVFIMGVEAALSRWASWLEPGGLVAFSEAVWLTDSPSEETARLWEEYPGIGSSDACRSLVTRLGYELLGDFVLPERDWLDAYYEPMQPRIDALRARHRDDPEAMAELAIHQNEIDVFRAHSDEYGYLFIVARLG